MFGDLHDWVARSPRDPGSFADVFRRFILETWLVGPGDTVLGQPVTERLVHSVRTLSLAAGVHPKGLRKLPEARGLIRPEDRDLHDNRAVFDAAAGEATARQITDNTPRVDLPGRLGLGRVVVASIIDEELLTPALLPDAEYELKERRYLRAGVDGLIGACLDGAEPVDAVPRGLKRCQSGKVVVRLIGRIQLAGVSLFRPGARQRAWLGGQPFVRPAGVSSTAAAQRGNASLPGLWVARHGSGGDAHEADGRERRERRLIKGQAVVLGSIRHYG